MVLYDFRKLLLVFLSWNSFMTQVMVKDDEWILTDIYYLENPQVSDKPKMLCLFVLMLYVPVNNVSVFWGRFLS